MGIANLYEFRLVKCVSEFSRPTSSKIVTIVTIFLFEVLNIPEFVQKVLDFVMGNSLSAETLLNDSHMAKENQGDTCAMTTF